MKLTKMQKLKIKYRAWKWRTFDLYTITAIFNYKDDREPETFIMYASSSLRLAKKLVKQQMKQNKGNTIVSESYKIENVGKLSAETEKELICVDKLLPYYCWPSWYWLIRKHLEKLLGWKVS